MQAPFWGQASGLRTEIPLPDQVIHDCCNHADRLIQLALEHHQHPRPLYPQMLITPGAKFQRHMTFPNTGVFDDPASGGTAVLFLPGDPATSWFRDMAPLQDLERAKFRIQYLQTLAAYMGHLVIEFDWNL